MGIYYKYPFTLIPFLNAVLHVFQRKKNPPERLCVCERERFREGVRERDRVKEMWRERRGEEDVLRERERRREIVWV